MSAPRPDPDQLQRRAADGACSAWVVASAGTGKTKVLTDRVLNLLLGGSAPEHILCLTFTKAAAAEMTNRLHERLGHWAVMEDGKLRQALQYLTGEAPDHEKCHDARRLFARVLDAAGGMKILTIHAFCQSLLRRFPLEAGVAPHFEVMDERSAKEALAEAREAVLARARSGQDARLAEALAEVTAHLGETRFGDLLDLLSLERARLAALPENVALVTAGKLGIASAPPPDPHACDAAALRRAAAILTESKAVTDRRRGDAIAAFLANPAPRPADFAAYSAAFLTEKDEIRKQIITKSLAAANPDVEKALLAEAERVRTACAALHAHAIQRATAALLDLAAALLAEYETRKRLHGFLDYEDLILRSAALLRRPGVAPWVLFKLDGGLEHILIDEAQDTNPEQWQVVTALAEEFFAGMGTRETVRTIFAVGDTKQSIYSFQRADPREFLRMRGHFAGMARELRPVALDISFRSTEAVLAAVDAVFAGPAGVGVALDGTPIHHTAHRAGHGGLVEIWPTAAEVAGDSEDGSAWEPPMTQRHAPSPRSRMAQAIAAQLRHWLDTGERLAARGRAVHPGDVMVLVRRRDGFVADLVRALKDRDIPVAGVDRMMLTEQLAVEDLVALGEFLLLPEDDLTLACVLKGPLFGLAEETLFALAHNRRGSLWEALKAEAERDPILAAIRETLSALLARADFTAPYELYAEILGPRRGRRAILERLGPDAADPIDEFLGLTLAYEREHVPSLQGFLHWLVTGTTEVKRDLGQGGQDEVRVMTVHGAKGLQAPIVFLPDTVQVPERMSPLFWLDDAFPVWVPKPGIHPASVEAARALTKQRMEEEYRRLLYVAMTRAEDRLYVCGWEGRKAAPPGNWHALVREGLAGCAVPFDFDNTALVGAQGWNGTGLRLLGRQEAKARDDNAFLARPRGEAVLPLWAKAPPPPEPRPAHPLAPSLPAGEEPATRSPLDGAPFNPAGFQRGLLIHRLLQLLPDLDPSRRREAAAAYLSRPLHGLTPVQQAEILAETLGVLEDPDLAGLFGPDSEAEVPITGLVGDYAVSGRIDRIVVRPDEVLIVDYKTLRPAPACPENIPYIYLRQLAAYRATVQAIYPGRQVRCILLWTDGPRFMPVPAERLDTAAAGLGGE